MYIPKTSKGKERERERDRVVNTFVEWVFEIQLLSREGTYLESMNMQRLVPALHAPDCKKVLPGIVRMSLDSATTGDYSSVMHLTKPLVFCSLGSKEPNAKRATLDALACYKKD